MSRKIVIPLTTRGNFGKMLSTMRAIRERSDLSLEVFLGGAIVRSELGSFTDLVKAEGFAVSRSIDYLQGDSGDIAAMTASAARAVDMFGAAFAESRPDAVVAIADRYEALSIAFAATCCAVTLVHLEGGESSGSIDDRIRHSITKLSQVHLASSEEAASRIVSMGESPQSVHVVGSPSFDIIAELDLNDLSALDRHQDSAGFGAKIDHRAPFLLVSQHPVVEEHADAVRQIAETAAAVKRFGMPVVWIQPNADAGSGPIRRSLSEIGGGGLGVPVRVYSALPLPIYVRAMNSCRCMVGNSSSGIREAAFLGVPVVNVGTRQSNRIRGRNVVDVDYSSDQIAEAIADRLAHGRFSRDELYGDGRSGGKIADILATCSLELNKPAVWR